MHAKSSSRQDGVMFDGLKMLVVEDDVIVALDVEDILRACGCAAVSVAFSVEEALRVLQTERPDAALLDLCLQEGQVTPVARALAAARVPFAVATGFEPAQLAEDPMLCNALYLSKPYEPADIHHVLTQLVAARTI